MSPRARRTGAIACALVCLIASVLSARMLLGARRQLALADRALGLRDEAAVDRHLRRALAYYLPGNPWLRTAAERLRTRASSARQQGQTALALGRWRSLRSALLMLRGVGQPHADLLREANAEITELVGLGPGAARLLQTAQGRQALAQRLSQPPAPRPAFVLLALFGFIGWTGSALLLCALGLTPELGLLPRRAAPLALGVVLGFAAFAAGLALA